MFHQDRFSVMGELRVNDIRWKRNNGAEPLFGEKSHGEIVRVCNEPSEAENVFGVVLQMRK